MEHNKPQATSSQAGKEASEQNKYNKPQAISFQANKEAHEHKEHTNPQITSSQANKASNDKTNTFINPQATFRQATREK